MSNSPPHPKLQLPIICLITDRRLAKDRPLEAVVADAVAGGVNLVQLREKDLPTRPLLDLARRLRAAIGSQAALVVNGRADIAFAAEADGVHLPADGMSPADARRVLGQAALVGRSIHSAAEARREPVQGADYLELGTLFPSRSHPGGPTLGPNALRLAAGRPVPIIGVGGVTAENAASVMAAGADGVAVISAILAEQDPKAAAGRLAAAVRAAWRPDRPRAEGSANAMRIMINGKQREISGAATLLELLQAFDLNPQLVAIEYNGEIVRRERYGEIALKEGDTVEIVHMVGGGAP